MKTVDLTEGAPELTAFLRQAEDEDIVVRLPDGSEFLLAAIDDSDAEAVAIRRNSKLMEFLELRARPQQTVSLGEVKRQFNIESQ